MSLFVHSALVACITVLAYASAARAADTPTPLTLDAAEQLALTRHPELGARAALLDAARANAAASGELPDPQLTLGVQNAPIDSLALDREEMTMTTVGVAQMFPPPGQRALLRRGAEQEASAAEAERNDTRARIRRDVRRAWLELFFLERALEINAENADFIARMTEAELARYRAGTGTQTGVLKSDLENDALHDNQIELAAQRDAAASRLARLLATDAKALRIATRFPDFPAPPDADALQQALTRHPQILTLAAQHDAASSQTAAARRAYYPEFGVEAMYGYRAGRDETGAKLPDMLSAQIVMSLPLFPDKRQDARLQERAAQELAARYRRDDGLLELRAEAETRLAEHQRLRARLDLLEQHRLPKAEQAVRAALAAYRSNQMSLAEVLELLHERHQYTLTHWRLKTDMALSAVELDYLTGAVPEVSDAH